MSTAKCEQDVRLPQELLEAIVEAVARCDPKGQAEATRAMKSLCLTCRALVPRCRRHIFREVRFDHSAAWASGFTYPRHNSSRVQAFLSLLIEGGSEALGSSIGDYVSLLRIDNNASPLIPQITARLPALKSLIVISSLSAYDVPTFFNYEVLHEVTEGKVEECDQDTRTALLASDSVQPVVQRLRQSCQHLSLDPLRLERLHVKQRNSEMASLDMPHFVEACLHAKKRAVTIRRLEFYGGIRLPFMFERMMGAKHERQIFSRLEYFNILIQPFYFPIAPILTRFANSLLGLELNLSMSYDGEFVNGCLRGLDLSALPNLQHLKLVNCPRLDMQPLLSLPNNVIAILSVNHTVPSNLETIFLGVQRSTKPLPEPLDALANDGSWDDLRRLVLQDHRRAVGFRHLTSFDVHFYAADFADKRTKVSYLDKASEKAKELLTLGNEIQTRVVFS